MDAMDLDIPRETRDYADPAFPLPGRVIGLAQDAMDDSLHGPKDEACVDCTFPVPMTWGPDGAEPATDTLDDDGSPLHLACKRRRCAGCEAPAGEPCPHRAARAA